MKSKFYALLAVLVLVSLALALALAAAAIEETSMMCSDYVQAPQHNRHGTLYGVTAADAAA